MADQIVFKSGQKQHFIATRPFVLGNTGVNISKGSDIFFDGTTAEYSGVVYTLPQLRATLKVGWLILAENYDEADVSAERPVSAGIRLRTKADSGNPLSPNRSSETMAVSVDSDEREVGNFRDHAAQTKAANDQRYARPLPKGVEAQDGVVARQTSFRNPSGQKALEQKAVLSGDNTSQLISQAEGAQIKAGKGVSEADLLERMTPRERQEYLSSKEAARSRHIDADAEGSRRVVAQIKTSDKTTSKEGFDITNSSGGGTEVFDPTGFGGKAVESTETVEGMTFKMTNGPKNKTQPHPRSEEAQKPIMMKDGTADARRNLATLMCSDFPANYAFEAPTRKKIARLQADYEDRPDVIRAVFAAESDEVKAVLVKEFPDALGR